jgi:hypothetical protein
MPTQLLPMDVGPPDPAVAMIPENPFAVQVGAIENKLRKHATPPLAL